MKTRKDPNIFYVLLAPALGMLSTVLSVMYVLNYIGWGKTLFAIYVITLGMVVNSILNGKSDETWASIYIRKGKGEVILGYIVLPPFAFFLLWLAKWFVAATFGFEINSEPLLGR